MINDDLEREARRVLEPLRYSPVAVASTREMETGRVQTVPRLAKLIESIPGQRAQLVRHRRWRRWGAYGAGAITAMAAGFALWLAAPGTPASGANQQAAQLMLLDGELSNKGTSLSTGVKYSIGTLGRLITPVNRGATFVTDEGVHIDFDADSTLDLSFAGDTRRIALNRGKIALSVPKLKRGTSLSVATPDAVVTVHGTRFSVEVGDETSCVRVSEGVVSVARGAGIERLTRGESSGCGDVTQASAVAKVPSAGARESTNVDIKREVPAPRITATGTLTQENRLFQNALAAEQSGDLGRARLLARRLLNRYPNSPMAPDTRRILSRLKQKQADTEKR
jgi:hypothetical protein